ncbi:ATP-binding protein [Azospirillum isscasi]|uniref:Adenylate/guanylate cyclase domain-containing protein n=1 Tax=Azospirillum isscasi TaxID=3053926 RepID=A0ABU0WKY6_9PROT|nr:adenylate/guanylate cyclase domain-containing protein [Azospirillum isscasi]MDQ2104831.1 adenylate/guanylate cyclase domain-containing protein [Azospirillum isscasi]
MPKPKPKPPPSADPADGGSSRRNSAERKVVTVLFADIVESSSMVSGRDPEEADQTLLTILQILTDAVERYGGTVAQVLGDGIMAVFGAPSAQEDHALRACLAAQDIARSAIDSDEFKMRIGISSGEVVAQIIETGVWTDYRTVGETVHVAAKLQQRAAPNSVLLSRETLDLVPTGLTVRPAGVLRLSATAEPVAAFALEAARAMRRTAMDLLSAEGNLFVGRRPELAVLTGALRRAERGDGACVLLTGEAGIGKSRLTGELMRSPEATAFTTTIWPQFPIRRLGDPDDLEAAARCLALSVCGAADGGAVARLTAAAARNGGELAGEAMRELLGQPSVHPLWQGLDPAQKADFSVEGLVAAVRGLSVERPLLILVEDAHWTRGLTNRLLDALAEGVEDARVFVLVTSRLDTPGGWTAPDHIHAVALEPLEPLQADEFLDHWLGHSPSLADLKARVAAQSQGVPLYLEESLRTLETTGAIVGSPGRYSLGKADARVALPATVHGLLASRIDALEPGPRRVLMHAAVIGTSVDVGLLRAVSPIPAAELPAVLARLEQSGFFARSRLLPNLELTFRHALVQEVAYATLTKRERQPLHGRVLHALRRRSDRNLPNRAELIAHHAFYAEDWPLACAYGRRAGRRAEMRCKHFDAGRFYEQALKALEHLPETRRNTQRRIDLWIAIPLVLLPQGRQLAGDPLEKARDMALGIGDRIRYARATSLKASFQWVYGVLDGAIALSRSALDHLGDRGTVELRIQGLMRLGGMLVDKGHFPEAREKLELARSLALAHAPRARFGLTAVAVAITAAYQGRCLAELGRDDEAVRVMLHALDIAEEVGHAFSVSSVKVHLALVHIIGQRFTAALPLLKDAVTITEATRLHIFQPITLGALGYAIARSGGAAEGARLLNASLEQAHILNHSLPRPRILNWMSDLALETAQHDTAVGCAVKALGIATEAGQLSEQGWSHFALAQALAATDRFPDAMEHLTAAETMSRQLSMRPLAERCRTFRRCLVASGAVT